MFNPLVLPVRIGKRGQMVLPAEVRRLLGVQEGDSLLLWVEQEGKVTLIPRPASYADALAGIGADVWKNVDPVEWQREERKSWPD